MAFTPIRELSRGLDLKSSRYDPCDRRMWSSRVRLGSNPSLPEPTDLARAGGGGLPWVTQSFLASVPNIVWRGGATNEAF